MAEMDYSSQDIHQVDLMDAIEEAVCFLSGNWRIIFNNSRLTEIIGGDPSDALGKELYQLFPETEWDNLLQAQQQAIATGKARIYTNVLSANKNEPIPILLRLIKYTEMDEQNSHFYAILFDLSELYDALKIQEALIKRNEELEGLTITCPLTGIHNRRYFNHRFPEEVERARRYNHCLGIAMVDIDHFKNVNDTYGHQVGDEVLQSVSATLKEGLRGTDILVRYGGEEFAVLFPEVEPATLFRIGQRLRRQIEEASFSSRSGFIRVTVSLGLSLFLPFHEEITSDEFLRRADEALYQAKAEGRNRVVLWKHTN